MTSTVRVVSIIPYKILPARLGGEKGIAVFSEYVGREVKLTGVGTKANDLSAALHYNVIPVLSNSRSRYANIFLYFRIRQILRQEKATHLLIEHPYYGWLAWLLRKTMKITLVVHSHNIEFERSRSIGRWWWRALKIYEKWVYHQSDLNFFISDDDRNYAIEKLNVDPGTAHTITYGVEISGNPADRQTCRMQILEQYNLTQNTKILLFNGTLHHHSNYDAVQVIAEKINPVLKKQTVPYCIFICGKGLPRHILELEAFNDTHIINAGFVPDISAYFKAADIFLNPIMSGGGIKTKAVEAIAYNCKVISTELGALGINRSVTGTKLDVVPDGVWDEFSEKTVNGLSEIASPTPEAFYQYYYWENIAKKVRQLLEESMPV